MKLNNKSRTCVMPTALCNSCDNNFFLQVVMKSQQECKSWFKSKLLNVSWQPKALVDKLTDIILWILC